MKFLIDNNLSPLLAELLREAGHEAEHVRDHDLHAAPDELVMGFAHLHDFTVISADTDFGSLLAQSKATKPSFILGRQLVGRRAKEQADMLLLNLPAIADDLQQGAVVVISDQTIRIRALPFPA